MDLVRNGFRPITVHLDNFRGVGMPTGRVFKERLEACDMNIWQGRIKYYRLLKGYMPEDMAERMNLKSGNIYTNRFEFKGNKPNYYYTSLAEYKKICEILEIDFDSIADEYLRFLDCDYDRLLQIAIEREGIPSLQFAQMHDIEYTTLRHSLKKMHKLSQATAEKYMTVLEGYGLWERR